MISVELTILILISNFLFFVFLYNKIRKYKENLKIINQKYNSIQSMVTAGSWELDIVTQETHWSNEVFKIHKLPIGKKINKEEALAFYPEKDRIKLVNLLNKCISNNEDFDDIFEFIDAEGNKKFVRSIGKSIIDLKTNKVLKLIGSFQDVTNQIKKEKDLIISQNKHRQLFMQSQDAIMTLNPPTWKFTSCNPATLKLFQVKNEEDFTNMGPWNISPEFQPNGELSGFLAEQAIKKAMRDGVYQFEWIHQDINGKKIPCQVLLSKVKEDEKEYLQATVRDISKEQELLNQLSESKEYLALAVEGTNLGIWDWDLRDNSVRFDNKWAEMLGYNITEIKMELNTWSEKVHPDDLNNCYADIKKYLDKQTEYYENIHRMKHKNGHWVYILDRGRISKHDKDGNPIRFTGTHLDITELMLNKQKLDLFFNKSPYGFAFCDMNGKFIEINNEFEKITGYTKDELNSLSYWDLTPEKYKKDEDEQILSLQTKGFYGPYKKEYIRKNNELIPIKLNGFIVENPDGSKGIWSIIEDISSQVKLEKELDTQKKISFHNAKLASIGELATGVGHEINNPLAILQGQMEMISSMCISKDIDYGELENRIGKSMNSISRISHIVKGLRTFARSDDNYLVDFNLSDLIFETKDLLSEIFVKDSILLNFTVENELFIRGNRGRIQQVLINLLNNAKDAMAHCSIKKILLSAKLNNGKIEIIISDTGTGIPMHLRDKIFQPFFTTKEVNKGTGIGLALVESIMKEHEGDIIINDNYKDGASFILSFIPVKKVDENSTSTQSKKLIDEQLTGNILIVDDEKDLREILAQILEMCGLSVVCKENGLEALNYIKSNYNTIDIIISDLKMPILDGISLSKKVKDIKDFKGKFICVSGGVDTDLDQEHSLDAVLEKPYSKDAIISIIKKFL